uniref:NADH dehydrogenase subunit 6 n=1 Tax=Ptychadena cooperi TaxID=356243 RepID=UPI00286ADA19|nr:NADH dehydrogenase subunit 6 [Ptychadena cooperi]WKT09492.1 NADH dehydrogenase subunit 6 [Ptychadena cooperi]WKT09505.1 NADH dehydrogenase subunit 6 [Ptychadena cooperi]WKT09518.1 NADH dehydrogenase subunit 6 [Ptychadena cooperi]WKT09544.1 NADH dehydrogenase subunit 6 [Ptychadena cooperi]
MFTEFCLIVGILGVASNPSPYYAALSLVLGAGAGCFLMIKGGVTFLSLVLFLIYLGGMMVVFAYCTALVAEPYPEAWGNLGIFVYLTFYVALLIWSGMHGLFGEEVLNFNGGGAVGFSDLWGVANLYLGGGWFLLGGGWGLLLCLFVVLEVVAGHKTGALKAV